MKKLLFVAAAILALSSCGNNEGASKTEAENHAGHDHSTHKHEESTSNNEQQFTDIDPACGMTRKANWDQYSVNGSDTTWFCSPACKEQFDANPSKFTKKS